MGVYCSLWLLGSISSTSRSYDTKLLESNIKERDLFCKTHCILSIQTACLSTVLSPQREFVRLCVSPNLRLAVIRPVLNSNLSNTYWK